GVSIKSAQSHLISGDSAFQSLQPRLEFGVLTYQGIYPFRLFHGALFQRLCGYHQNSIDIRGGDGRGRSNGTDAIVAKGGEEVLGHWPVVTELLGVVPNVVPAGERQPTDFR